MLWFSVKHQELADQRSLRGLREYALELLQHRTMWWQPAVATTRDFESADRAVAHIFYSSRIDEISGRRAGPSRSQKL